MALLDEVKVALRVSSDATDPEIRTWIAAAKHDLRRLGVADNLLKGAVTDPLVKAAVVLYVKANYGYDNDEAQRFRESYERVATDICNSPSIYGGCYEVE